MLTNRHVPRIDHVHPGHSCRGLLHGVVRGGNAGSGGPPALTTVSSQTLRKKPPDRSGGFMAPKFGRSGRIRTPGHWFWSSAAFVLACTIVSADVLSSTPDPPPFVSVVSFRPAPCRPVCRQFCRQFSVAGSDTVGGRLLAANCVGLFGI